MKKYLLLLVSVFFSLALVACGSEEKTEEKSAPTASDQKGIKESNSKTNEKTLLTKVGKKQKYNAQGGVIELMKIKEINQTIDVAPIKMTVQNIKLHLLTMENYIIFKLFILWKIPQMRILASLILIR
ncbi:hypothetical protein [Bacillus thuringiensis]|uniref:Lipoprotein n=1 Tax=Bacillus thuringiensis serovar toumanoffi TaxID=180862 RepID=A0ABD5HR29_BACTU|nr:hypothetical protein [Bacillus thuringiensis]MCR6784023.1 hypothetical protein [Bacillus thuringiensis]MCR6861703.1 hypothetical protein [Bacillus thuringiensis]MCR6868563.1 hypothetical protein [Bacillus thuringiensis]MDW9207368.1 hypothetical protein [Bacillus thuringiensis serovar toumanoffi]MDY0952098.1 hypothetical protein [Bacillus thuringiensis]